MRVFKNKMFHQWAEKLDLLDSILLEAIAETEEGSYEAHLSAHVYKKRIALPGRGKRSGARTIIALKKANRAFFLYGFAKNKKDSISDKELDVLKNLAHDYFGLSEQLIEKMLKNSLLWEIKK